MAGLIETQLFKDQSFGGFAYAKYGEPGNFGTGYWGRKIQDPAERRLKLTTELNNGRLAMVAMTAMLIQKRSHWTVTCGAADLWAHLALQ